MFACSIRVRSLVAALLATVTTTGGIVAAIPATAAQPTHVRRHSEPRHGRQLAASQIRLSVTPHFSHAPGSRAEHSLNTSTQTPHAPFHDCPAIGADTSCGVLIFVTDAGVQILHDPTQSPYDGGDDTLVGVRNASSHPLLSLALSSNTDIFGFDGDGICTYGWAGSACSYGPTGYEGPSTHLSATDASSGSVSFGPLSSGGSAFLGLEDALSTATQLSSVLRTYVALGDSYSSGEGTRNYNYSGGDGCDRGSDAWPVKLASGREHLVFNSQSFFACSGAKTSDLGRTWIWPAGYPQFKSLSCWVDGCKAGFLNHPAAVPAHGPPDLVTITIGGNDVGFGDTLQHCFAHVVYLTTCHSVLTSKANWLAQHWTELEDRFAATYTEIKSRTRGRSRIVVVGYPDIMVQPGDNIYKCGWIGQKDLPVAKLVETLLRGIIHGAASQAGVDFVNIQTALYGHELCTQDTWMEPISISQGAFQSNSGHPRVRGQQAMADAVATGLDNLPNMAALASRRQARSLSSAARPSLEPVSIDTSGAGTAAVGVPYFGALGASGGADPYTWSVASGALPPGLALDAPTGVIDGTIASAGSWTFTVHATDSSPSPQTATADVTIAAFDAPPVSIAHDTPPPATVGQVYNASFAASGGLGADTWSIASGALPNGLSLDPTTGNLQGVATVTGSYPITVAVADSSPPPAYTDSFSTTLTVTGSDAPLTITTSGLAAGTAGADYADFVRSTGGTGPVTWSVTSGSLPDGLTLDSASGAITGIATTAGDFSFSVQVTDRASPSPLVRSGTVTLHIDAAPPPTIESVSLPDATQGVEYADVLDPSGGVAPYQWSVTAGALPPGITLDPNTGEFGGVPAEPGNFDFTATLTDGTTPSAQSAQHDYTISVSPTTLSVAAIPPTVAVGDGLDMPLTTSGGVGPFTFAVTGGTLPDGLVLDTATGDVSGIPTTAGTYPVTLTATDSSMPSAQTASVDVTIAINDAPPLAVLTTTLPDATIGGNYRALLDTAGGTAPLTWSITAGSLPTGLSLEPDTGAVVGTPTQLETTSFTVSVTDTSAPTPQTASAVVSLTVGGAPPLAIATASLSDAFQGSDYNEGLLAVGGDGNYSWSLTAGTLPTGLTLSSAGTILGQPQTYGTYPLTAEVSDGSAPTPQTASVDLTLTVNATSGPEILTNALANTVQGEYNYVSLDADGGVPAYTYTLIAGALPDGVTLSTDGAIYGEPTNYGTFPITVQLADNSAPAPQTATRDLTVSVEPSPPLTVTTTSLPSGTQGQDYGQTLSVAGGAGPYSYTLASGQLPAGVTLDQYGDLYGVPTVPGSFTFAVSVTDSTTPTAQTAQQSFTLTIAAALTRVSVGDVSLLEGNGGSRSMVFPVTLSKPATSTISVHYAVRGVTATGGTKAGSGIDFKLASGTVTFKPNTKTGLTPIAGKVSVTVYGDTTIEPDETFAVTLSNPTGGYVLGRSVGTGTILNDDGNTAGITAGIGDALIVNANSGSQSLTFPVTLSGPAGTTVSMTYTITPGSATYSSKAPGGGDYGGKTNGTITFTATGVAKTITVPIWPDANPDTDETFTITLSGLTDTNVTLIRPTATGTILAN